MIQHVTPAKCSKQTNLGHFNCEFEGFATSHREPKVYQPVTRKRGGRSRRTNLGSCCGWMKFGTSSCSFQRVNTAWQKLGNWSYVMLSYVTYSTCVGVEAPSVSWFYDFKTTSVTSSKVFQVHRPQFCWSFHQSINPTPSRETPFLGTDQHENRTGGSGRNSRSEAGWKFQARKAKFSVPGTWKLNVY